MADGPVGSACRPLLRSAIPNLVLEVDAQGSGLSQDVLQHLAGTATAVMAKPGGVTVDTSGLIDSDVTSWSLEAIRQAAIGSRSIAQSGETAVVHVLVLRGEPDQGDERIASSIGIAFSATEFVVFPDRVDSLALLLGGADAVLRAVTVHELGHLLCLVNISYTSQIAHEDPAHPGHSSDQSSVMFHAIETTAIGQLFSGPPPDRFAQADLDDLDGLRAGRY